MNSYFYDVEVFPNFFSVTFISGETTLAFYEFGEEGQEESNQSELLSFLAENNYYIGYYSNVYDDPVMDKWYQLRDLTVVERVKKLYEFSGDLIATHKHNKLSWKSLDLANVIQKGDIKKSLKEIAINLGWHRIQDLPYPYNHIVKQDEIAGILEYNENDVLITKELYRAIKKDIAMRTRISRLYGVDVTGASNSTMSSVLLDKLYSQAVGSWGFKYQRTKRGEMKMSDIVVPGFDFETERMQRWLVKLKESTVRAEDNWGVKVLIGNTSYDMKKGGIHSIHHEKIGTKKVSKAEIYESDSEHEITDIDARSYYPRLMVTLGIKPSHLKQEFLTLVDRITGQRLAAKARSKNKALTAIEREDAKVEAEALKVTINSIFGKFNYENYWLYDPLALYRVTINGQLFLLQLIEALTGAGFNVFYANTDGITVRSRRDDRSRLDDILATWETRYSLELETNAYRKFVLRDVNNYLVIKEDGHTKAVGDLNKDNLTQPTVLLGLTKKFEYPVVTLAIHNYFVNGLPVAETINNHTEVLDFCISQKVGKTYQKVTFSRIENGRLVTNDVQRTNRYLVSKPRYGGSLYKWKGNSPHQIVARQHIHLMNDNHSMEGAREKVQDSWYINEAEKVIGLFKTKQLGLFQ